MPLFESNATRTRRLFDRVINDCIDVIGKNFSDQYYRSVYAAAFGSAGGLAQSLVTNVECVKRLWGKAQEHKVAPLFEVCLSAVISMWFIYREQPRQVPADVFMRGKRNAVYNVLTLIGRYSSRNERDLVNLDRQLVYDLTEQEHRRVSIYYSALLVARLKESWTSQFILDWDSLVFPVRESTEYRFAPGKSLGDVAEPEEWSTDILTICLLIPQAGTALFEAFDQLTQRAEW